MSHLDHLKLALTAALAARGAPGRDIVPLPIHSPPLRADQAEKALFGHHNRPNIETFRYWLKRFAADRPFDQTAALHDRFGWDVVRGVWKPDFDYRDGFEDMVAYTRAAVYYGLNPQDAWTVDRKGEPTCYTNDIDAIRGRWLMYHDESESYLLIDSRDQYQALLNGDIDAQHCRDVTGVQEHEERWDFENNQEI